ncbi:MAG: sulfite exporter TauE/SafE family protein [Gammaproteobacteria bacterium]|nr:sulfite exporter TauE/SafE family protein [Gammaproteobacteria bacterium]
MEVISLTLPAALLAGLAFGAGPCNVTCLPYLGPVFMRGDGVGQSWRILLPFTLGRLSGYSMLGFIAGMAGQVITELMQSSVAGWILGIAAILVGLNLMLSKKSHKSCHTHAQQEQTVRFTHPTMTQTQKQLPAPLFMMGAGMALNPCVPLTAILAAAAASGSSAMGLGLGLTFGLGAVVIPTFIFGLVIAHFGAELKQHIGSWSRHVDKVSGSLLILLGIFTAVGWVQP